MSTHHRDNPESEECQRLDYENRRDVFAAQMMAKFPDGFPPTEEECEGDDYKQFRGKCKEMCEAAIAADPSLTLVRGHYWCPFWGEQTHWWTVRTDGTIFDPTARQFPSKGMGQYIPFDGFVECSQCGKRLPEEEASFESNYCFCSGECHCRFVGL